MTLSQWMMTSDRHLPGIDNRLHGFAKNRQPCPHICHRFAIRRWAKCISILNSCSSNVFEPKEMILSNTMREQGMRCFKDISTDNSNDNHKNKKRLQSPNKGRRHAASAHDRIISAVHLRTNDFSRRHAASLFVMDSTAAVGEMREHKKHLT